MKCWLLAISHPTSVSLALTVNPTPDLCVKESGAQTSACITVAWRQRRVNTRVLLSPCVPKAIMLLISAVLEVAAVATTPGCVESQANGITWCRCSGLGNHRSDVPARSQTNSVISLPVPLAFVILIPRNEQRCGGGILPCPSGLQSRAKAAVFVWQRRLASRVLMLPTYFRFSDWYRLSLSGSGDPLFRSSSTQPGTVQQSAGCFTMQHMRATDDGVQDCIPESI